MRLLLDTNICVYALKNRPRQVLKRLQTVGPAAVAVSVITVVELRQGADKSLRPDINHAALDDFLEPMTILPFEERDVRAAARVRAHLERIGKPIGDFDSLIAGQGLARDLIVVTNNVDEFGRVPDLSLVNWAEE